MGRKPNVDAFTKLILVKKYIARDLTFKECLKISEASRSTFKSWIKKYRCKGSDSFVNSPTNKIYSKTLKLNAVNDYLNECGSLFEICLKYDISSTSVLLNWIKNYNSHRCTKPNTRSKTNMTKSRKTTFEERIKLVAKCIESNYDYNHIVNNYNVSYNQIYNWVKKYNKNGETALVDNRGKAKAILTDEDKLNAKIKLLEAENRRLQMENDFIKKLNELEGMEMLKPK